MVTGLDLVEWMIRIAAGERLTLQQKDIRLDGWAIEARLYAEDPTRGFLPATGRLVRYREPSGSGVRVDSGVHEGAEVTVHYDPILAKLVTHAPDRSSAVALMRGALDAYCIRGVVNNGLFLSAVMAKPRFQSADLSTDFIHEEFGSAFNPAKAGGEQLGVMIAVAAALHHRLHVRDAAIGGRRNARKVASGALWVVLVNGDSHKTTVAETAGGHAVVAPSGSHEVIGEWRFGDPVFLAEVNGRPVAVQVERVGLGYRLSHDGVGLDLQVLSPRAAELAALMPAKKKQDTSRLVLSPMPGLLSSLAVAVGHEVKAGEAIAVIEAMKMENVLRAERDGRVAALRARPGDSLAADQPILEFE
jgi:propionyl-CoA carboxylase alpha chain